jgi:hypothetical protein
MNERDIETRQILTTIYPAHKKYAIHLALCPIFSHKSGSLKNLKEKGREDESHNFFCS